MERAKDMSSWDIHFPPRFPPFHLSPEGRLIPTMKTQFEEDLSSSEAVDSDQESGIRMSDIAGAGFRGGKELNFEAFIESLKGYTETDCSFDLQDFDMENQASLPSIQSEPEFPNLDLHSDIEPEVSPCSATCENAPKPEETEVGEAPLRRSKRRRVPPLDHWLNESLEYRQDNTLVGCLEVYPKSDPDSLIRKRRKGNPTPQSPFCPQFPIENTPFLMSISRPKTSLFFSPYPNSKLSYCLIYNFPTWKLLHMRFPPKGKLDDFRYAEGCILGFYWKGGGRLEVKVDAMSTEYEEGDYFYVQTGSSLAITNRARRQVEVQLRIELRN